MVGKHDYRCVSGPVARKPVAGAARRWAYALAVGLLAAGLCGCSGGKGPEFYVERLGHPDDKVRETARDELVRMQEDALEAVIKAFETAPKTQEGLRQLQGAAEVLVRMRTLESLETVGARIEDPEPAVRLTAIRAVGGLAQVRKGLSAKWLTSAMSDPDPACVHAAATGLRELNFKDATAVLEEFLERGEGVQAAFAADALYQLDKRPGAAQFLLESLSAQQQPVRTAARERAVELGDRFVVPLVRYSAEHPQADDQEAALALIRDRLLEELDKELSWKRRQAVVVALGRIGDEKSCAKLMEIVAKGERNVRASVLAAGALGDAAVSDRPAATNRDLHSEIRRFLKKTLHEEGADSKVQIACAISLCRLGDEEGVEYLLAQLESLERTGVGEKAVGEEEARALTELRIRAQEALTSSGDFVVPYLLEVVKNPETGDITCWAAAQTLGALRVKEAVPFLGRLLLATVPPQRVESDREDPPGTLSLDTRGKPVELSTTRRTILEELFGERNVIPAQRPAVRMSAAFALGRIGGQEARRLLSEALAIHENVRAPMQRFAERREYLRLIPDEATKDEQRSEARWILDELCRRVLLEQGRVLFYIRLAVKEAQQGS